MNIYRITDEDLEDICNNIKSLLIDKLYKDNLISKETCRDYLMNYAIIVKKPSFFHASWNKIIGREDVPSYIFVRQESFHENQENTPDNSPKNNLKIVDFDNNNNDKKGE